MLRKSLFLLLMLLPFFMFGTDKIFPEKILFNITFNEKTKINGKYLKSESKEIKLNEAEQENIEQIDATTFNITVMPPDGYDGVSLLFIPEGGLKYGQSLNIKIE